MGIGRTGEERSAHDAAAATTAGRRIGLVLADVVAQTERIDMREPNEGTSTGA
jgi:hypothetical protein